ncbi:hypothetical protein [Halodesulfovibrio aestuarii]|uniref:hypothetical protein n=1 Tax=Halodesulfovibrio aestuarii TaxID=126333 RepID=UPI003D332529
MINSSVIIRRKLECVRNSVGVLKNQQGITAEDELNISNIYRMIAQIDERHRHRLNLSGHVVIPLNRRALAADCLTAAERRGLADRIRKGGHHDPAA